MFNEIYSQIGPNVSISPNARIGPGVRLLNCIILDDVEIMVRFHMKSYCYPLVYGFGIETDVVWLVMSFLTCLEFWQDNAIVMHAIVGWKSIIGRWSRVQVRSLYRVKHLFSSQSFFPCSSRNGYYSSVPAFFMYSGWRNQFSEQHCEVLEFPSEIIFTHAGRWRFYSETGHCHFRW